MRLPNLGQKQKQRVREGQRRREEASSREKAAPSQGSAETRRQRRIQAAPSPSGVDSSSAESTQRLVWAAASTQGRSRDQAAAQNPGGTESQRC